jgi:hypothetical protein
MSAMTTLGAVLPPDPPSVRRGVRAVAVMALVLSALVSAAAASTTLDFVSFDGIDYIRWPEEAGRVLTRSDLGTEFGTVQCSIGEDVRGCPYGVDAGAAFLPAGTRLFTVRGHPSEFRLAAVWRDRIFLYQAWRNPRAKVGGELYALSGKVRAIDVQRGQPPPSAARSPATIGTARDVEGLVEMLVRSPVQRPQAHAFGEPRYWLTFWLTDGTTLERAYFVEPRELMGGVVLPAEFTPILERYLGD